jgi:hypothetical protein
MTVAISNALKETKNASLATLPSLWSKSVDATAVEIVGNMIGISL